MYISGHPLDRHESVLSRIEPDPLHLLAEYPDESVVFAAGMIVSVRTLNTKKGQPMAFAEFEDRIHRTEVVLFPDAWRKFGHLAQKGNVVLVRGKLQLKDEDFSILADEVHDLNEPDLADRILRERDRIRRMEAGRRAGRGMTGTAGGRKSGAPARKPDTAPGRPGPVPGQAGPNAPRDAGLAADRPIRDGRPHGRKNPSEAPSSASRDDSAGEGKRSRSEQHVYVKIDAEHEQEERLARLQTLLVNNPGPIGTVLYYERTKQAKALSDRYRVKPSRQLFTAIEELFGEGTVKVK
jgi:DNA polymerase-3 subunit alpha